MAQTEPSWKPPIQDPGSWVFAHLKLAMPARPFTAADESNMYFQLAIQDVKEMVFLISMVPISFPHLVRSTNICRHDLSTNE